MKKLIIATTMGFALTATAQDSDDLLGSRSIEMIPSEKRSLSLKPNERNPYAKRTPVEAIDEDEETNAEELAIRQKLSGLSVSGSSRNLNGLRLLLGDIVVERGKVLPQLIENQSQFLKVLEVNNQKIVLGWLDVDSGELTGKTMQLIYDLSPSVKYVLQGQINTENGPGKLASKPVMGVIRPNRVDNSKQASQSYR